MRTRDARRTRARVRWLCLQTGREPRPCRVSQSAPRVVRSDVRPIGLCQRPCMRRYPLTANAPQSRPGGSLGREPVIHRSAYAHRGGSDASSGSSSRSQAVASRLLRPLLAGCAAPEGDAALGGVRGSGILAQAGADRADDKAEAAACDKQFESSFAAIQELIFERKGCTANACHGSAKLGGLDLRADVAWESLVDAASANSATARADRDSIDSYHQKRRPHPSRRVQSPEPHPIGRSRSRRRRWQRQARESRALRNRVVAD